MPKSSSVHHLNDKETMLSAPDHLTDTSGAADNRAVTPYARPAAHNTAALLEMTPSNIQSQAMSKPVQNIKI
eukprot:5687790-Ditylum_brightwellii.AAC.1